jgi:hypothetical protein
MIMRSLIFLLFASFGAGIVSHASAQTTPAPSMPPVSQVLKNVRREYDKVRDYTVDLRTVVDMPGMKAPPMTAKIYHKKPDKLHIESQGFAMLPRDMIAFSPEVLNEDNFDAVIQGTEIVEGINCIKVKLLARSDTIRLQRIMLSVDPQRWIILKMNTEPAHGNAAEAHIAYTAVDNAYLLPSVINLRMTIAGGMKMPGIKSGQSRSSEPKLATVTMNYSNYRVNKGIDDAIFRKDDGK